MKLTPTMSKIGARTTSRKAPKAAGFTLVELLVVIAIVVILAALVFAISTKAMRKSEKVQCLAQIRDVSSALGSFSADYQRPPIPETRKIDGMDTVYGDDGGTYHNDFIVASLMNTEDTSNKNLPKFPDDVAAAAIKANPKGETYWSPQPITDKRHGVCRDDGRFYDPWGKELMFAINTPPYNEENAGGKFDSKLFTAGKAEYADTKPRDQDFVVWSYGRDKVKANAVAGSDDVISW